MLENRDSGVIISNVPKNSIADFLDFKNGDRIISVNDESIAEVSKFAQKMNELKEKNKILIKIIRNDEEMELEL